VATLTTVSGKSRAKGPLSNRESGRKATLDPHFSYAGDAYCRHAILGSIDAIMAEAKSADWRDDIDALCFQPQGHENVCMVHRLAFRTLLRHTPTREDCLTYFTAHAAIFNAAAGDKISRKALDPGVNFHLTSRDLARTLILANTDIDPCK
jgi:hypothetical protein